MPVNCNLYARQKALWRQHALGLLASTRFAISSVCVASHLGSAPSTSACIWNAVQGRVCLQGCMFLSCFCSGLPCSWHVECMHLQWCGSRGYRSDPLWAATLPGPHPHPSLSRALTRSSCFYTLSLDCCWLHAAPVCTACLYAAMLTWADY